MREIKFRAWDKKKEKLYTDNNWPNCWFLWLDGTIWSIPDEHTLGIDSQAKDVNMSEDFILMQYTGLRDKNGKEIYEGDILVLRFRDGEICCDDFVVRNFIEDGYALIGDKYTKEVIGNIYENPELLEKK